MPEFMGVVGVIREDTRTAGSVFSTTTAHPMCMKTHWVVIKSQPGATMHPPPSSQPAPSGYHLPEKDRQAILQKSDFFKQSQEIEAQRQRFMQLNNCDQWGQKNDR